MKPYYEDILTRITSNPIWWDEHGVPRYNEFAPVCMDIYACENVLLLIRCQHCGRQFQVGLSADWNAEISLAQLIEKGTISYGDPPQVKCCLAGASTNSESIKVLQYWAKDADTNWCWLRLSEFEVELE
jgi:hypothetical protein